MPAGYAPTATDEYVQRQQNIAEKNARRLGQLFMLDRVWRNWTLHRELTGSLKTGFGCVWPNLPRVCPVTNKPLRYTYAAGNGAARLIRIDSQWGWTPNNVAWIHGEAPGRMGRGASLLKCLELALDAASKDNRKRETTRLRYAIRDFRARAQVA